MTIAHIAPLTAALKAKIEEALEGQGVPEQDEEELPDIPVFTEITEEKHRLYVRLEMGTMLQGNSNVGHADRHAFLVRIVHENTGLRISKADAELPRVAGLIVQALKDWEPIPSAHPPKFISSFLADDPDPAVQSRVCRFSVNIFGE